MTWQPETFAGDPPYQCDFYAGEMLFVSCDDQQILYDYNAVMTSPSNINGQTFASKVLDVQHVTNSDGSDGALLYLDEDTNSIKRVYLQNGQRQEQTWATWTGLEDLTHMQVFSDTVTSENDPNANVYPLTILMIIEDPASAVSELVMIERASASSPVAVDRADVIATEALTSRITQYDFTSAVTLTKGSVDTQGRKMIALVTCDEICQSYEHSHTRRNHIQVFQLQASSFMKYEIHMEEPAIQQINFKLDLLVVSQPDYFLVNPNDGVADLLGKITIFDVSPVSNAQVAYTPFNQIKVLTGDQVGLTALSIGESMELRQRLMYGKLVYELFYHNWHYTSGVNDFQQQQMSVTPRQVKIGRLGILDDLTGVNLDYIYDNDYSAFTPSTLTTMREAHFGLIGERIALKSVSQNTIHYSSVCGYDQYYTNLGSMSSQPFCQPCRPQVGAFTKGGPNDPMITLGVQDTQCMSCSQLQYDQRPIPRFFYEDICTNLPDCSTASLYPIGNKMYNIPARGVQRSENIVSASSNFISAPIQGCTHTYQLQTSTGMPAPSYYSISNTGVITFQNDGNLNNLVDDYLKIVITATGGLTPVTKTTTQFRVQTQCGADSTQVTVGQMPTASFPAALNSANMQVSGSCTSSQPLCPINWQQLSSGDQYFSLTYQSSSFQSTLRQQYTNTPSTYTFGVLCQAVGGAQGSTNGQLTVTQPQYDCTTAQIYTFGWQDYTVRYDLPSCSQNYDQTIFFQSSAYIAPAITGCTQTFYLKMADNPNAPVPTYYRLDPVTGKLSFDNRADRVVNDRIVIEIHSTDGITNRVTPSQFTYPHVQKSQIINVKTQCGLQSTVITAPTLATRTQMANQANSMSTLTLTDSCTSCNALCPITTYSLSQAGQSYYQMSNTVASGQNSFTVNLNSNWRAITGTYDYSVVCNAEGGASKTATGQMIVAQPEYDCRTATVTGINANKIYDIPAPGQQRTETIFNSATEFITAPITGCSQSYRLEMVNGSPLPSYYSFNQQNGQLSVNINGNNELINDILRIVVSSTDGVVNRQATNYVYPYEQMTSQFTVQTRCGPSSTTVIAPTLGTIQQHSNAVQQGQENRLEITNGFSCSNPRCPITSTTLVEGNTQFSLVTLANNQLGNVGNNFLNTQQAFKVSLNQQLISTVGVYNYAVQGTCQGGSTARAPGVMEVTQPEVDCTGSAVGLQQTEYRFNIPREGQSISQTLFETSSAFVTPPISGCFQTYELSKADGSPAPSYFNMNTNTGYLSFTNSGDQLINDCFTITIISTDGLDIQNRLLNYNYPHYQYTQQFCVITECGPLSTAVTASQLAVPSQASNLAPNPLVVSGSFTSSNARCPMVNTQLQLGFDKFTIQNSVATFSVSLNSNHLSTVGCYQYIVRGNALGGATGDASSQMCITAPQYDCTQGSMRPTQTSFNYDVAAPNNIQNAVTLITQQSYTNTKPSGCTQCFSLERRNGQFVPNYYQFNDISGVLSFTNQHSPVYDELILKVYSTQSASQCSSINYEHVEENIITVRSVCGINSAECRLPTQLFDLAQPSNAEFNGLFIDDFFQSTNPACPVTSISLIEGQVNYDLITSQLNQQNAQFSVELKDSFLTTQNTYQYTLRANIAGGTTCDAPGRMTVSGPQFDCTRSQITLSIPDSSQEYCIPNAGQQFEQELFSDASEYVTNAEPNCARSYALEMTNGSPMKDYFVINPVTGRITVTISGSYLIDDVIRVVITSGDYVQRTGNIYIVAKCCETSTVITTPQLSYLQQPSNAQTNALTLTSDFDSSNALCPITTVSNCFGAEHFDFVADVYNPQAANAAQALYDEDYSDFQISLKSSLITTQASYVYDVCATALGGATSTHTSTMTVTAPVYDCTIPTPRDLLQTYDFEIPRAGAIDTRTLFMSSAEYISSPIVGCMYTYALESCNANSLVPDRYHIETNGKMTVATDGDADLFDDQLRVVISSFQISQQGQSQDIKRSECFHVRTRCGPSSTEVVLPTTCPVLSQTANANFNTLIREASFTTTNPRCTIQTTELTQGRQNFDFLDYGVSVPPRHGQFKVSLNSQQLQTPDTYTYTVRAYAQGGAFAIQECSMQVTPAVYDCSLAQPKVIQDNFNYYIPLPGSEQDEVLFQSSVDYFGAASPGCNQQYSIELTPESTTYGFNYYSFDINGKLTFRNVGYQTVVDHLEIKITTVPVAGSAITQYSEQFTVTTECGPDSTQVLTPNLNTIDALVNGDARSTERFSSSNNRCPILSHQFCAGSGSTNQFNLIDRQADGFDISLKDSMKTQIGSYTYKVCATAEGGAVGEATGVMRINSICGGAITQCTADKQFYLPEFGETDEVLLTGRQQYISELAGCTYSYQIKMANGGSVPNYYSIDQADGSVEFENRASTPVDERIGIVITAQDQYGNNEQYETCFFKISSVCGVDSTRVVPPTAEEVQVQTEGENVISVTGSFGVTNPSCPIQIISLLSDSTPYFRLDQTVDMRFVVTRHNDYCFRNDVSSFTVFAQARGMQSNEFDYDGFFCRVTSFVEPTTPTPEITPITPVPDPTPTPVLPTPVVPVEPAEPTPQIVVISNEPEEESVVRSAAQETEYPWAMTVLVVAVILCAMCLVFVVILYCCREKMSAAPPVMMAQQPVMQQQIPVEYKMQQAPVQYVSDTASVMSVPTVQRQVQYVQAPQQVAYAQQSPVQYVAASSIGGSQFKTVSDPILNVQNDGGDLELQQIGGQRLVMVTPGQNEQSLMVDAFEDKHLASPQFTAERTRPKPQIQDFEDKKE